MSKVVNNHEGLYLFAILDKVSGKYESWGVYANKSIAARVLVATYAFNGHPAINKRLADFDLVQIGGIFKDNEGDNGELVPRIVANCGSLQSIKAIFDVRDGVFALPDNEEDK